MSQDNFQLLILLRISMFFVGFAAYFLERKWGETGFIEYPGELLLKYKKEPGDRTAEKKAILRMRIPENVYFQMQPKKRWITWLTKISLGTSPKIGVPALDNLFQIATDNQLILKKFRNDLALQSALVKTHSLGFETIKSNGNGTLVFDDKQSQSGAPGPDVFLSELATIKKSCDDFSQSSDLSGKSLNVVRALWYGIAFYSLAAVASYLFDHGKTHLDFYDHVLKGGATSLLLIAAWVSAVVVLLKKSSWIPVVLNELLVFISVFALIAGPHLFGDLNRVLDLSSARKSVAVVERKYTEGGSRRGSVTYFLELTLKANPYHIPRNLQVSFPMYLDVEPGQLLEISIKPGFFNCPFISGLKLRETP